MKVLTSILGVLVIVAGIYCCVSPIETQVSIAGVFVIVMGVAMIIHGIGEILSWNDSRKLGLSNGWTLAGGIASIILGVILLGCDFFAAGIVYATFCSYFLCIWLIICGIMRIGAALTLRREGLNWAFVLIVGVLMIIAGVCCIGSPVIMISFMGIVFGVSLIIAGISLISLATATPTNY